MSDYMAQLLNAKEASMNTPSPPVGLPTEAPWLDDQIAYIGESIDGECGCFMCRHNRAILASLERLKRSEQSAPCVECGRQQLHSSSTPVESAAGDK